LSTSSDHQADKAQSSTKGGVPPVEDIIEPPVTFADGSAPVFTRDILDFDAALAELDRELFDSGARGSKKVIETVAPAPSLDNHSDSISSSAVDPVTVESTSLEDLQSAAQGPLEPLLVLTANDLPQLVDLALSPQNVARGKIIDLAPRIEKFQDGEVVYLTNTTSDSAPALAPKTIAVSGILEERISAPRASTPQPNAADQLSVIRTANAAIGQKPNGTSALQPDPPVVAGRAVTVAEARGGSSTTNAASAEAHFDLSRSDALAHPAAPSVSNATRQVASAERAAALGALAPSVDATATPQSSLRLEGQPLARSVGTRKAAAPPLAPPESSVSERAITPFAGARARDAGHSLAKDAGSAIDVRSSLVARIDGEVVGEIEFRRTDTALEVRIGSIVQILRDRFKASELDRISKSAASDTFLSIEHLQKVGLPISHDPVLDEFNIGSREYRPSAAKSIQKDAPGRRTIDIPLLINGVPAGSVAGAPAGHSISVRSSDVRQILSSRANETILRAIDTLGNTFVAAQQLSSVGLEASFDQKSLSLNVQLPPEAVRERSFSLRNDLGARPENAVEPAQLAGFVNLSAGYVVADGFNPGFTGTDGPLSASLDLGLKVGGFEGVALRSSWSYDDSQRTAIVRNFTQIIHDDYESAVRYTLGDLTVTTREFQSQPSLAGLSVERRYADIQPFRFLQPGGREEFLLRESAQVDILVNGAPVQRLRLAPGRYNLQDFPLSTGTNDVSLRILDDLGQERFLNFTLFSAPQLLESGLSEFAVNIGVLSDFNLDGGFDYSDDIIGTGFYRWGLTDQITPEFGLQISEKIQNATFGAVLATPIGAFDLDLAGSRSDEAGVGYAASLNYTTNIRLDEDTLRFDLSALTFDEAYRTVEQFGPQLLEFDISARLSAPLPFDSFGSLGIRYSGFRDSESDFVLGATLGRSFGPVTLFASVDIGLSGNQASRGLVSLFTRFGRGASARASTDPFDGSAALEFTNFPEQITGDLGWRASLQRQAGGSGLVDGEVSYRGNRFEARASQQFVTRDEFTGIDGSRTNISGSTALVFADGDWAFSRPVFESFAIVNRHRTLRDATVLIDERDGRAVAESDPLGPAVVNDLNAYARRDLDIDIRDRPQGFSIPDEEFVLFPSLNDGYTFTVGDEDYITFIAQLVDETGEPIGRVGGEAILLTGPESGRTTPLFTTSSGRLVLLRLREGRYRLRLFGDDLTAEIEIREDDGPLQRQDQVKFHRP
jgi:outer membrane usher protein